MSTQKLKAGQTVIVNGPFYYRSTNQKIEKGTQAVLRSYRPSLKAWQVLSKKDERYLGIIKREHLLPVESETKSMVKKTAATKQKTYNVDAAFIKQAHAAACDEWKKKIEEKFPSEFLPKNSGKYFYFGEKFSIDLNPNDSRDRPIPFIGAGCAPKHLENKCIMLSPSAFQKPEVEIINGFWTITFKHK